MSDYPEHDKQYEIINESQAIGAFLDHSGYVLAEVDPEYDRLRPVSKSINDILAEYFEIDLNRLEAEKRRMLDSIRL